jgi:hypothetical protein
MHVSTCPLFAPEAILEAPLDWWYDQHTQWPKTVAFYLWHRLAASTRCTYSTGQCQFINFIHLYSLYNSDRSILPASQNAIMSWVTNLAGCVQPKTIKAYLTANLLFTACESPVVGHLIRGIKKYHGEKD